MSELKDFISSGWGRRVLSGLGVLLIALLIFHAGVSIGSRRHFQGRGGPGFGFRAAPGFFEVRMPRGFIQNGHGTVGTVESVSTSSIMVDTRDGSSQTVLLTDATVIRSGGGDASSTAVSVGQQVIVLGTPNDDGSISANLIRSLPSPLDIEKFNTKRP